MTTDNRPPVDTEVEAIAWAFHSRREMWSKAGFRSWDAVEPWVAAGIDDPSLAERWDHHDIPAAIAAAWIAAGIEWPAHVRAWADAGWTPEQTRLFILGGFHVPGPDDAPKVDRVEEWRVFAGDDDRAAQLASHGFTLAVVARAMLNGDDLDALHQRWEDAGFDTPASRNAWELLCGDHPEARAWRNANFWSGTTDAEKAHAARGWRLLGFTAHEAEAWNTQGVTQTGAVRHRANGLTPEQHRAAHETP